MSDQTQSSGARLDANYVEARRVLLDALTALAPHGAAVIVAGAQAIYLQTGDGDLAVAPYTTDGDVTLDPSLLTDEPELEKAMRDAGFQLSEVAGHTEPGVWLAPAKVSGMDVMVPVDLIVPDGVAIGGRRGARLGPHGKVAARRAVGLEAALVDHSTMTVAALEPADGRSIEVEVAGVAALLVAKAHKLRDRIASGKVARVDDKDAADVYRLMQTTDPRKVGRRLRELARDDTAGAVTADALDYVEELFARRGRRGVQMATRALRVGGVPATQVQTLCISYTERLLSSARSHSA